MAVCTVALCLQTHWLLQIDLPDTSLLIFLFTATLFSYNIHFYLAAAKGTSTDQLHWFKKYELFTIILTICSLLVTAVLFIRLRSVNIYILLTVVLNALYTLPLLFKSSLKLPLAFTFIKSYFIGFTWAVATVVIPLAYVQKQPDITELCIFVHRFLLVSLATLIFDYRDKQRDRSMGVLTPANTMTDQQYHRFFLLNVIAFTASVLWLMIELPFSTQWLQLIPCMYMWWLYLQSKKRTDDLFYLSYVDGSLFLSALLSIFLLF
jgi:uncharacterized membrane protein AbrB (regulator of aidB expression)